MFAQDSNYTLSLFAALHSSQRSHTYSHTLSLSFSIGREEWNATTSTSNSLPLFIFRIDSWNYHRTILGINGRYQWGRLHWEENPGFYELRKQFIYFLVEKCLWCMYVSVCFSPKKMFFFFYCFWLTQHGTICSILKKATNDALLLWIAIAIHYIPSGEVACMGLSVCLSVCSSPKKILFCFHPFLLT